MDQHETPTNDPRQDALTREMEEIRRANGWGVIVHGTETPEGALRRQAPARRESEIAEGRG